MTAVSRARRPRAFAPVATGPRIRRAVSFVALGVAFLIVWEALKWFGGVPWRFENVLGTEIDVFHDPPFRWPFANDLTLPHWFNILAVLGQPVQRGSEES